jgi:outer membrane protein assembly factor BamB
VRRNASREADDRASPPPADAADTKRASDRASPPADAEGMKRGSDRASPPSAEAESMSAYDRARRRAPQLRGLRAVPLAVLVAAVVAAMVARVRAPRHVQNADVFVADAGEPSTRSSGGLAGPIPPPSAAVAAGTRSLHGGARRTHRAAGRGPRSVKIGYRAPVGGPVAAQVTTSPDEATLYVATLAGDLIALDRVDGSRRWTVPLGDRAYAAPLVHEDGTIFAPSDAKKLVAVRPDGRVLYRLDLDGEADTAPAFSKEGHVVLAAGRRVYAVSTRGNVVWQYVAAGKIYTAPAVTEDGLVIVGAQDDRVHAIDGKGARAWSVGLGADVDGSPCIADDGTIYVGTDAREVVALDPKGAVRFRTAVGGFVRGALSIARNGDVLAGTYGPTPRVVRIDPSGAIRGAFAIEGTGALEFGIHGAPLEDADGALYFGAQDDAVYAVGPDGLLRFRFLTAGDVDAPLTLLSDGSLVVPSEDGTVTLLLP